MDLYEALKSGTSAQELQDAFYKELNDARDKVAEEAIKQAEEAAKKIREAEAAALNKEYLDNARYRLADALVAYAEALTGDFNLEELDVYESCVTSVEEILKLFEVEMNSPKQEKKEKKSSFINLKHDLNDDDIIAAFLSSLK